MSVGDLIWVGGRWLRYGGCGSVRGKALLWKRRRWREGRDRRAGC